MPSDKAVILNKLLEAFRIRLGDLPKGSGLLEKDRVLLVRLIGQGWSPTDAALFVRKTQNGLH